MDIRDPNLNGGIWNTKPSEVWVGCHNNSVLYRINSDGRMIKKPYCADCESRGVENCGECDDIDKCQLANDECNGADCTFHDLCMQDGRESKPRSEPPFNKLKGLCFRLKEYHIKKIDNGLLVEYHIGEKSNQRFFSDTESLSRFIEQHTDLS